MEDREIIKLIDTESLDNSTNELAQQIIEENDVDRTKEMVKLFNLNQSKKNVIRVLKLTSLLDKISDQIVKRFDDRPGEFSNADLISYMQTIQAAIDKANKTLDLVQETPAIQINNNTQVNVVEGKVFNREERQRIIDAVNSIVERAKNAGIDVGDYTVSDSDDNN